MVSRCLDRAAELGVIEALDDRRRTGRDPTITAEARELETKAGIPVEIRPRPLWGQVRSGLTAGAKRIRTLSPTRVRRPRQPQGSLRTPRWRESDSCVQISGVAAVQSICSSRRATPWSRGECGGLRCHLTPLRRRPILELCQCNMRPCARRAAAGPAGDRVYRCPSFSLEIEHFRGSAPGVDLVRRSSRRQRYCRIPPDKSAVFCRRPTSSQERTIACARA